jgi:uncharacterized protein with HEPN domain
MTRGSEQDPVLLQHIRECIERIGEYTGGDRRQFERSRMAQDAVVRNLQVMAESTQRLSDAIKATEPTMPWRDIAGFRNVLAHGYLGLDLDMVWSVVEQNLPALDQAVTRMAGRAAARED